MKKGRAHRAKRLHLQHLVIFMAVLVAIVAGTTSAIKAIHTEIGAFINV